MRHERSSHRRCSVKKMFSNISQKSQENTCARVSFLTCVRVFFNKVSVQCNFIKKETLEKVFCCEFCEISNNTFFTEHLWAAASRKNYSTRLSKSLPTIVEARKFRQKVVYQGNFIMQAPSKL